MDAKSLKSDLEKICDEEKAIILSRFFKTGVGQYGEGDKFMGVTVPKQRELIKNYDGMPLSEISKSISSEFHEVRLSTLLIMVNKFNKSCDADRETIYNLYISNTNYINNWDLVDLTAEHIVGVWLGDNYESKLIPLAKSDLIWDRRIAMMACFYHIKHGNSVPAFKIIEILKNDSHDLIQKAVGWMLREIGKRCSIDELKKWLKKEDQYKRLPRTTLRYAIEHFEPNERSKYLKGEV